MLLVSKVSLYKIDILSKKMDQLFCSSFRRLLPFSRMLESLVALILAFLVDDFHVLPFAELLELGVGQKFVDQCFLSIFLCDSI